MFGLFIRLLKASTSNGQESMCGSMPKSEAAPKRKASLFSHQARAARNVSHTLFRSLCEWLLWKAFSSLTSCSVELARFVYVGAMVWLTYCSST